MTMHWQRPNIVKYPQTWQEFYGKENGKRYCICDVTEEYHEEIMEAMIKYFLKEEPTCKYLHCSGDVDFINTLKIVWKSCFEENLSIMVLSFDENDKPSLAGFLFLTCCSKDDQSIKSDNEKWQKICNIVTSYGHIQQSPFEHFNISYYLSDLGLLVLPDHRKQGIASRLLSICEEIGKQLHFKLLFISLTAAASQAVAKKLNFSEYGRISYEALSNIDSHKYGIDGISQDVENVIFMYKLYES